MFLRLKAARRRERGATSVIVVVLLVPVLLGAAALSVDLGQLMMERRQVQNGADAAVVLAANTCAKTPANCPTTATTALTALAGNNANDGTTTVESVCGSAAAKLLKPTLTLCPTAPTGVTNCPPVPASVAALPYLEVRTITANVNGTNGITSKFASIATGNARNTTVGACARAAWGPAAPASAIVFPVLVSYCDWKNQTGYTGVPGSAVYPSSPDYAVGSYGYANASVNPWPGFEQKIYTKDNPTTCPTWNGHAAPGGFYSIASGDCTANSVIGDWVQGTTGNSSPCSMVGDDGVSLKGKVIYVPVFDCKYSGPTTITASTDCNTGTGSNTYYHVAGYAAFYVSGWYFSSDKQQSVWNNQYPCTGGERCVSGWFLKDLVSAGQITPTIPGGSPNFGLSTVQQAG